MTVVGIECDGAAFQHHFKKVWKVTEVGIECDVATVMSRRYTPEIVLSRKIFFKILQARLQKGL